jgi:hypothetical protein
VRSSVLGALAAIGISMLALAGAPPAGAVAPPEWDVHASVDTIEVPQTPLEFAAVGFARAFAAGSADGLDNLMSSEGIRLQIEGPGGGGLSSRQAVASLLELVRRYEGGTAVVSRAEPLDGTADRGFAEVLWSARAAGTSDLLGLTLFLGLARQSDEWRVDEVRLLR